MKVLLHVNYYEGPGKLDELFRIADLYGYDGVELRRKYNFNDMTQAEYEKKVAALKSQYPDMEITFGGIVDFCRGAEDQVKQDLESYMQFIEWAAAECGTKVMNFFTGGLVRPGADYYEFDRNGSGMANEDDYLKSAEGLKLIGDKAAAHNMLFALETHNCYLHDLPAPCRKLMDMTNHDAIGINYDHGNITINKNGSSIAEVFETIGDKIYYAHLKNLLKFKNDLFMTTRLEEGHIDTMDVVKRLQGNLKSGMAAVEYACPGDGIIAAKRDMEYMKFIKEWLDID